MNSFLRIFGLTLFAAAGVALAVWLATSVAPETLARGKTAGAPVDAPTPEPVAEQLPAPVTIESPAPADTVAASPAMPANTEASPSDESAAAQIADERATAAASIDQTEQADDEPREARVDRNQPTLAQPEVDRRAPSLVVRPVALTNESESWPVAPRPSSSQLAASSTPPAPATDPASLDDLIQRLPEAASQYSTNRPTPTPPAPADAELPAPVRQADQTAPAAAGQGRAPKSEIKASGPGDKNLTIHIQDTDIREVLDMLSEQGGLNILASRNVQGKVSASLTNVDIDTALAAILKSTGYVARHEGKFIYVGNPQDFHSMEQAGDKIGTRVFRPNYVKAADLQALIVPLLTPQVGTASVTKPAQIGIASDSAQVGGDGYAGTDALLVHDYEAVLMEVDQVFEEIDKRPTQVAIEAMILSVKLDDANSFGVDFQFLRNQPNIAFATGSPPASLSDISFSDGGLKFGFLDSSLGAFLNALEVIGDTNVIATPRLMCLNKHRAEILIGSKLGYITKTLTQTTTAETVDFMDVGTALRIRPFISSDGLIRMEVHPELSTGEVQIVEGLTVPDKHVTEVTTNVMVRDGCTVIIGGLMQEELDETTNQVPLLGRMPGIGWLFRSKQENTQRSEIIILITPHIVYEPETCAEGAHESCKYRERQAVYADRMSPIGTRYLGRKYLRLAEASLARGDRPTALRQINLSIGFDPSSRVAIDLRHKICGCAGPCDFTSLAPCSAGPPVAPSPDALDGKTISPWLLDHLGSGCQTGGCAPGSCAIGGCATGGCQPTHPLDPGRTGTSRSIERPGSMQ